MSKMRNGRSTLVLSALALVALGSAFATQAEARGHVGVFVGLPLFGPPPVVYAPPPVYYYPPPPVVYAPAPAYVAPSPVVDATPSSAPYVASDGETCREYSTTVNIGGQAQQSYGTACLQPDGTWRIVR